MAGYAINATDAPEAIGPYSHAVRAGNTIFLSGQIALSPDTNELNNATFEKEARQVFKNLSAVLNAAGATMRDIVKLNVYLKDLENFALLNAVMSEVLQQPYPARAAIQVAALPRNASVEVDAIAVVED